MATKEDVHRLKRLLREAFEELLSIKSRLRGLEKSNDADLPAAPPGTGVLRAAGARDRIKGVQHLKAAQFRGAVDVVGGASWRKVMPESSQVACGRCTVSRHGAHFDAVRSGWENFEFCI